MNEMRKERRLSVRQKIQHSLRQTWYGLTLLYIAFILTMMFCARIFNWEVG